MKKTSKILSLLVALCMAVTMLSGLTVFAEGELEVIGYEADADFIILDFSEAVNLTADNVTLSVDGEPIEVTVAAATPSTAPSNIKKMVTTPSYKIVPASGDGIALDTEYRLTLLDVENADGTKTIEAWAKTFTVENYGDSLEFDEGSYITRNRVGNGSSTTMCDTWESSDDNSAVTYTTTNSRYMFLFGRAVGADVNGNDAGESNFLGTMQTKSKNYTYKVSFEGAVGEKVNQQMSFNLGVHTNRGYTYASKNMQGVVFQATYNHNYSKAKVSIFTSNGVENGNSMAEGSTTAGTKGVAKKASSGADMPITVEDSVMKMEMKLTVKDGFVRGFIDGVEVIDYVLPEGVEFAGYAGVQGTRASSTHSFMPVVTVKDFLATYSTWNDAEPELPEEPEPEPEPTPEVNPELLVDWDADLDFITLDFEEELGSIDVTLSQAGTPVPVTVGKADHADALDSFNARATYKIKPVTGGLTRNLPYTLHVNAVTADGTEQIVAWNKTFKVEVLEEGLTLDGTNKVYSAKASSSTSGTVTNIAGTDDIRITYEGANASNNVISKAVSPDSNASLSLGALTEASKYTASDYTVKATFKNVTGTPYANVGIAKSYSTKQTSFNHNWFRGTGFTLQVQPKDADDLSKGISNRAIGYLYANTREAYASTPKYTQGGSDQIANLDTTEGIELKLSVKNEFARAYINGGKIFDYVDEGAGGAATIFFAPKSSDGASVDIVDFIVTKAVAITDNIEAFEFSAAEVTGSFASGTVSVATTLTNNTAAAKNIFAVCALYDATDAMKNIVISTVSSAASGVDTEISFANVATNGATKAKIFIWDSAAALNPWFPAIIAE